MSNRQLNFAFLCIGILIGAILTSALFLLLGAPPQSTNIETRIAQNTPTSQNTPTPQNLTTPQNGNENRRLTCEGGIGITGRVSNAEDGTPVIGANVFTEPPTSSVTTDSDGNFIICSIDFDHDGSQFTVYAVKNGYLQGQAKVEVQSHTTIIADIFIQKNP